MYSKDQYRLEGDVKLSDITPEEFENWTLSTWFISPESRNLGSHPVPFPEELPRRAIKLWTYRKDVVLDIFCGSGTTCCVAKRLGRRYIGIDNCNKYVEYARTRIDSDIDLFDYEEVEVKTRKSKRKNGHFERDIFDDAW